MSSRPKTTTAPPKHPALVKLAQALPNTPFFKALTAPYLPVCRQDLQPASNADPMVPQVSRLVAPITSDEDLNPNPLTLRIWKSTGHWSWVNDLPLSGVRMLAGRLNEYSQTKTWYGVGLIGRESVQFLCKTWSLQEAVKSFVSELALNKVQLHPLHGTHILPIIGVYTGQGVANVIMEPPHHQFWISPSSDVPNVLKHRCVQAYEQIHSRGVLHGNISLENIVIGADCRVHLLDFERAKALEPIHDTYMQKTTEADLRMEMRQVKFLLDYDGARVKEVDKWNRQLEQDEWNLQESNKETHDPNYVPRYVEPSDEDTFDPPLNWTMSDNYKPSRFIIPGTTMEVYIGAVEKFVANIRRMEKEGDGPPSRSPSPVLDADASVANATPPSRTRKNMNDEEPAADNATAPRYSLRKRKTPPADDLLESPTKRSRNTTASRASSQDKEHVKRDAQPEAGPSRLSTTILQPEAGPSRLATITRAGSRKLAPSVSEELKPNTPPQVTDQPEAGPSTLPTATTQPETGPGAPSTVETSELDPSAPIGILKVTDDDIMHSSVKENNLNLNVPIIRIRDYAYKFKMPYEHSDVSFSASEAGEETPHSPREKSSRRIAQPARNRSGKLVKLQVARHWGAVLKRPMWDYSKKTKGKRVHDATDDSSEEGPALKKARLIKEESIDLHPRQITFAPAPDVYMVPKLQRLYTSKSRKSRQSKRRGKVSVVQLNQPFVQRFRRECRTGGTRRVMIIYRDRPTEYRTIRVDNSPSPPPSPSPKRIEVAHRLFDFQFPFTFSFHLPVALRNVYQWFGHNARIFT